MSVKVQTFLYLRVGQERPRKTKGNGSTIRLHAIVPTISGFRTG